MTLAVGGTLNTNSLTFEHKNVIIFLAISLNMSFGCSKEPSRDGSLEYPQHIFWLRNKKNNFSLKSGGLLTHKAKQNPTN